MKAEQLSDMDIEFLQAIDRLDEYERKSIIAYIKNKLDLYKQKKKEQVAWLKKEYYLLRGELRTQTDNDDGIGVFWEFDKKIDEAFDVVEKKE